MAAFIYSLLMATRPLCAWLRPALATAVELAYETNPGDKTAALVKTTALVPHSENALHSALLRDCDALWDDDVVGVALDTFDTIWTSARFEVGVLDSRVSWQLDPQQRLRLSLQGSRVERGDTALYSRPIARRSRDLAAQLLYSYTPNPRSALYAGYSHGGDADDRQIALTDNSRSVFVKLSDAWQP